MRIRTFRWTGRNCFALMLLSLLAAPAATAGPLAVLQERLLQVDINRQQINETVMLLEDAEGRLYVASQDLQRWRLRIPVPAEALQYQNENYVPLLSLAVARKAYDPQALTLSVEMHPQAFLDTTMRSPSAELLAPQRAEPGGFFNYEIFLANSDTTRQRSGEFELGVFNQWGVGVTSLFVNQLASSPVLTRLDTTWTRDRPELRETWRLGDAVSTSASWGRSVRFGGVQLATNFATQPGFATFTPQSVTGQAVMPSTVEVFINNAMVSRQTVPPGPFSIGNLPVVSGAGAVRVVVRDLFGREQVVNQPFYASQALLSQGLRSFSYEAGFVREDFGQRSDSYGAWVATGTFRYGLTDQLTTELHGQAMAGQATLGVGGDYLIARLATLSAYVAASHKVTGSGGLILLGVDRVTPSWSFAARTQRTSAGFAQVGDAPGVALSSQISSAQLSYVLGAMGAVSGAYIHRVQDDQTDARILTVSYSVGLGGAATFSISAVATLAPNAETRLLAMLSIPLGATVSASVSSQLLKTRNGNRHTDFAATVQRNLPGGSGYGYQLQSRTGPSAEGTLSLQNSMGTYSAGVFQNPTATATQLSASGGVALLSGRAFASRRIDQSFAVVEVPGYANVRVMVDNQMVGRTGNAGRALIPRLRAYDVNAIAVDQRDLPMDAEIGTLTLPANPYFHSGVVVRFPIKRTHAATLNVVLGDGSALPLGATVRHLGLAVYALLGSDGEVYVTDMGVGTANVLRAQWRGQSCEFEVPYTAGDDPLPDLGTFIYKGVIR